MILQILFIAIGVSMDACAVSVCKGLCCHEKPRKTALVCALWFSIFQMLMPLIGYLIGSVFASYIEEFDHWIAFVLLVFIGGKMLKDVFSKAEPDEDECPHDLSPSKMFALAIATSIDALAIGITFAMIETNMFIAIPAIGICTFLFSFLGALAGKKIGEKHSKKATFLGGLILILMGIKILVEHLFF